MHLSENYYLRPATNQDKPIIIDLLLRHFDTKYKTANEVLKKNKTIVLCNKYERIEGVLSYRFILSNTIFISYAIVDYGVQGNGITKNFFPTFLENVKKQGVDVITGAVSNKNNKALLIFKKFGFKTLYKTKKRLLIGMSTSLNLSHGKSNGSQNSSGDQWKSNGSQNSSGGQWKSNGSHNSSAGKLKSNGSQNSSGGQWKSNGSQNSSAGKLKSNNKKLDVASNGSRLKSKKSIALRLNSNINNK
ncbi:GNAT family N-acetyltransferase [Paenibacillus lupini]|uniref:GNAT family N-acetyltransferase n=1 Tax=Paenibacillus lupini TaxID=1450204 RepID=UPI0014237C90|nr:GNAT family N-acetyltransferase [Paenibacillus lupini]NIK24221.1 L-amino acid N-acyltransferase YncA [Paenibacillus lupini]